MTRLQIYMSVPLGLAYVRHAYRDAGSENTALTCRMSDFLCRCPYTELVPVFRPLVMKKSRLGMDRFERPMILLQKYLHGFTCYTTNMRFSNVAPQHTPQWAGMISSPMPSHESPLLTSRRLVSAEIALRQRPHCY